MSLLCRDRDISVRQITDDKRMYLPPLLLADEQRDLVERYLDRGDMFLLERSGAVVGVCVVTNEGGGALEVQNLAVRPDCQRRGYGRLLLDFVTIHYAGCCQMLWVGTGDSPLTVPFYQACGFRVDHRVPRGIADAYDHPIYEAGVRLIDKVYLRKDLGYGGRAAVSTQTE
jgi:ribosomal protein S18 acetylase RimI-like enzyme